MWACTTRSTYSRAPPSALRSQGCPRPISVRKGGVTDAEQLAARTAADPHTFLGAHPDKNGGVVVRAFRPAARAVHVLTRDGGRSQLKAVHPRRGFGGELKGKKP